MTNVNTSKDVAANAVVAQGPWIACFTGSPGQTTANEVSGGSPAYARKSTTWTNATGGTGLATGSVVEFDIPPGTSVTYVGYCTGATGANCYEWVDSADISFTPQGKLRVTPKYQAS